MADAPLRPANDHRGSADFMIDVVATARLEGWRQRASVLDALVKRPSSDRQNILAECSAIQTQILDTRTDLIFELAEAPQGANEALHLEEIEKALDSVVKALRQIEQRCRS
jgi:hypothetical protein